MKRKKSVKKKIIIAVVVLLLVVIAVIIYNKQKSGKDSPIPQGAVPVEAEEVHIQDIVSSVKAEGSVKFDDSSMVYASSNAKIIDVKVKQGDDVNAGDVLVEYDPEALDDLKNSLADAELELKANNVALEKLELPAEEDEVKQYESQITSAKKSIEEAEYAMEQNQIAIDQARLDLASAEKDYNNAQILLQQGVITKSEFDTYKNKVDEMNNNIKNNESQYNAQKIALEKSEDSLELAQTQYDALVNKNNLESNKKAVETQRVLIERDQLKIKQIKEEIAKFKLRDVAPCAGTIVQLEAESGEMAQEGKLIAEIGDMNKVIITLDVNEYDMADVKLGQDVKITGDALNDELQGKISKIYPTAEEKIISGSSKTVVTVEVTVDSTEVLRPGYSIDGEITTKIVKDATVVPIMAYMTESDTSAYVFIIKDDYSIEKRPVKLKTYADLYVEVEGVSEGELVVSSPDGTFREGMLAYPSNINVEGETTADEGAAVSTEA